MKSKNLHSLQKFKLLIQNLLVLLDIWREIRDDIASFLEESNEDIPSRLFLMMCEFGELFDKMNTMLTRIEARMTLDSILGEGKL